MSLLSAAILFSTILPLGLFLGYFATRSRWNTSKIGRIMLGLALALMAVLVIGFIAFTFGPWWLDGVRVVVYTAMHIGTWRLFATLRHVQRSNDDGTLDPPDIQKLWNAIAGKRKKSKD